MKSIGALALLLVSTSTYGMIIRRGAFTAPEEHGVLSVLRDNDNSYAVLTNKAVHRVQNHDVDSTLKKMNREQLAGFLVNNHGKIRVSRFTNGDFKLNTHVNGDGGGIIGCWLGATLGKVLVSGLGHGTIYLIGGMTGPAAPFVVASLEAALGPTIEATSIYAAAVGGMTGAAVTGPV
jgi:hypothetical protein